MSSQAFRDAAYPQETGEAFPLLLMLEHEDWPDPVLWTDAGDDIVFYADLYDAAGQLAARRGRYLAMPIEAVPPSDGDDRGQGTLRIPNIDPAIGEAIDQLSGPAKVTLTAVLASSPREIVGGPWRGLELTDVRGDALVIEGAIGRPSLSTQPWPKGWIRPRAFKAVFRL